MSSFLWVLIVGGIIGATVGVILGKDMSSGITRDTIMGFLGSWVASLSLPSLGPVIGGFPITLALLGATICITIYSFIVNRKA